MSDRVRITINRREANFDRACDEAYDMALEEIGDKIDSDRDLVVRFVSYAHEGTHVGHSHLYVFEIYGRKV